MDKKSRKNKITKHTSFCLPRVLSKEKEKCILVWYTLLCTHVLKTCVRLVIVFVRLIRDEKAFVAHSKFLKKKTVEHFALFL